MVVDVLGFKHDVLGCQCLYYEVVYGQKGLGRKTIRTQSVLIAYHYEFEVKMLSDERHASEYTTREFQFCKRVYLLVFRLFDDCTIAVYKQ